MQESGYKGKAAISLNTGYSSEARHLPNILTPVVPDKTFRKDINQNTFVVTNCYPSPSTPDLQLVREGLASL